MVTELSPGPSLLPVWTLLPSSSDTSCLWGSRAPLTVSAHLLLTCYPVKTRSPFLSVVVPKLGFVKRGIWWVGIETWGVDWWRKFPCEHQGQIEEPMVTGRGNRAPRSKDLRQEKAWCVQGVLVYHAVMAKVWGAQEVNKKVWGKKIGLQGAVIHDKELGFYLVSRRDTEEF